MSLLETILDLIEEVKPGLRPGPDEELIKSGRLDSVEVMSLVMALTGEFDIEITPARPQRRKLPHRPRDRIAGRAFAGRVTHVLQFICLSVRVPCAGVAGLGAAAAEMAARGAAGGQPCVLRRQRAAVHGLHFGHGGGVLGGRAAARPAGCAVPGGQEGPAAACAQGDETARRRAEKAHGRRIGGRGAGCAAGGQVPAAVRAPGGGCRRAPAGVARAGAARLCAAAGTQLFHAHGGGLSG